jgi:hypothetical protein
MLLSGLLLSGTKVDRRGSRQRGGRGGSGRGQGGIQTLQILNASLTHFAIRSRQTRTRRQGDGKTRRQRRYSATHYTIAFLSAIVVQERVRVEKEREAEEEADKLKVFACECDLAFARITAFLQEEMEALKSENDAMKLGGGEDDYNSDDMSLDTEL